MAVGHQELEFLALGSWASRRRQARLVMLDRLNPAIEAWALAVEKGAESWAGPFDDASGSRAREGLGVYVHARAPVTRFENSKQRVR